MSKYETAKYEVIEKDNAFEIRKYQTFYTAKTEERNLIRSNGFNEIFDYISGNNEKNEKISMTTPVINDMKEDSLSTEFVMPSKYSYENLPEPNNPKVKIKKINALLMASVTFSGNVSESKIKLYEEKLIGWLERKNLTPVGNFKLARYNPPFIPPFLRKNEILIEIK